jgi:ElaB/YqjD/DUF883 family membrane-anchored ribosome-binding protein
MANPNGNPQVGTRDVQEMVERARTEIEDVADRAKRTLDDVDQRLSRTMQENPLLVLGAAVGVGYVIGRLFSRFR